MVPEEDQHHGLLHLLQPVGHGSHGGDGDVDAVEVVVEDVAGLLGQAGFLRVQVDLAAGVARLIGAVVLVAHGEGEHGAVVGLQLVLKVVHDLLHEQVVRVPDGPHRVHQLFVVVLTEPVLLKAQVLVDVLAVIEPGVARVAAPGGVALVAQVPDIGVHGGAEVLVLAVAGEEAPLAVHGAAGEDVGEQIARHRFLLQLMPGLVNLPHAPLLPQGLKVGEVAEGLQHHPNHVHLLVLGDVLVLILGQHLFAHTGGVALWGRGQHVLAAVQKGIDHPVGQEGLGVRPLVDEFPVGGLLVELLVKKHQGEAENGDYQRAGRANEPHLAPAHTPGHQGQGKEQAAQGKEQHFNQQLVHLQAVVAHNAPRFADQLQILGQEGVAPQLDFEVVGEGDAQHGQGSEQVGQPAPSGKKVPQPDEQHPGQQVQDHQSGGLEVPVQQLLIVQLGGGGRRQGQTQQPGQAAQQGQAHRQPHVMPGFIDLGAVFGIPDD